MVLERLIFRQHDKVGSKITRRQLMKIKHLYIKSQMKSVCWYIIKEISKTKNKTDFSQHSCTKVFTDAADLQVQCLSHIYISHC
jgi:hypothetical protein